MKVLQQDFYQAEIDRCMKIYDGFKDAASLISAVYSNIITYLEDHPDYLNPDKIEFDEERATELIRGGQIVGLEPIIDNQVVADLLLLITKTIGRSYPELKGIIIEVDELGKTITTKQPETIFHDGMINVRDLLNKETSLERDMVTFLFSLVFSTIYKRQLEPISEVLRTDLWEGGNCPLCGESPHFGMLSPDEGAKHMECWLCGTNWMHARVKCPFCNNEEQEDLGYFTVEGRDVCRIHYCKKCSQYYKIFDARNFSKENEPVLTIHNFATLDYDFLAGKEGFKPGSGLEWVNESELTDRDN